MARPNSTVVVLAGAATGSILAEIDRLPNVRASETGADATISVRELTAQAHTPYVVHDKDPLAGVSTAWAAFFENTAPHGTLEVAVEAAINAIATGEAPLPDYYLVLDPDALTPTAKHWWFGVLARLSPSRVIPSQANAGAVRHALSGLPSGRWWPDPLDSWLRNVGRLVPDDRTLAEFELPERPLL